MGIDIAECEYIEWINTEIPKIAKKAGNNYQDFFAKINERIRLIIGQKRNEIIGNSIQESYYLRSQFDESPFRMPYIETESMKCTRSINYFCGMYYYHIFDYKKAVEKLKNYISETELVIYEEYVTDIPIYLVEAQKVIDYLFPFDRIAAGRKLILYGAGLWGTRYYEQIRKCGAYEIVAIADQRANEFTSTGVNYIAPNKIEQYDYDVIFVTLMDKNEVKEIKKELETKYNLCNVMTRYDK
jgi:hypothetical protein